MPVATRAAIANSLGAGGSISGAHVSHHIVAATNDAFVTALGTGLTVGADRRGGRARCSPPC